jgi:hypothetical protein
MAYLIDSSVLARLANTVDALYAIADRAIMELHQRGEVLHVAPQNLIEFRNAATRPKAVNGLGLSIWHFANLRDPGDTRQNFCTIDGVGGSFQR